MEKGPGTLSDNMASSGSVCRINYWSIVFSMQSSVRKWLSKTEEGRKTWEDGGGTVGQEGER